MFPEGKEVELYGKTFEVRPFSYMETREVLKKLKSVLHLFFSTELTIDVILDAMSNSHEGIRDIVAMSLRLDSKIVDQFDQGEMIKAIRHIIEVNKDFFTSTVENELTSLTEMFGQEENSATPS